MAIWENSKPQQNWVQFKKRIFTKLGNEMIRKIIGWHLKKEYNLGYKTRTWISGAKNRKAERNKSPKENLKVSGT